MAVLLRETRILDGKEFKGLKVFKSENPLITREEEKKAELLDNFLEDFFKNLTIEVKTARLFDLKSKPGVIELWYHVGANLKFVDDPKTVHPSDRRYIWQALWQHAGELAPGEMKSRAGTARDHFLYCYRLAKYEKEFVVLSGSWRNWQEFFDSPILSNRHVIEWFERNIVEFKRLNLRNWLRDFMKLVRNRFQNVDLSFLTKDEIAKRMDFIFSSFISTRKT